MANPRGFLEHRRLDPGYRPRAKRVRDFRAVELRLGAEELNRQAARCMDCGIPFCHGYGCPLANAVPEINDLVCRGRWQQALALLVSTNPFPELTGRLCPALCEGSCVLGLHDEPVAIRQVELEVIEAGFEQGLVGPQPPQQRRAEAVAVVGSGPAGLAVAHVLNQRGYHVTVFESALCAGGILRYGVPDFKLEKWVLDRRVSLMEAEGIVFETGVEIGRDISYRYLRDRFAAIVLTGGARQPRDLQIPGRQLGGIHFAMTYLVQQNRRNAGEALAEDEELITAEGRTVVVLGGGDTGSDCLGTALRQGARRVVQMEILPEPPVQRSGRTPWPEWPDRRRDSSSHQEGGERRWSVLTEALEGSAGRVERIRCATADWPAGPDGRPVLSKRPGSEFTVVADLVLLALGFTGVGDNPLADQLGLACDARGLPYRDECGMTRREGVFVAGDMAQGASLVVRAIADGMRVAGGVDAYLESRGS